MKTKLKNISQNEEFVYWSERNGFVYLEDYCGLSFRELNHTDGFTPRMYKELSDLIVRYNLEEQFPDFS